MTKAVLFDLDGTLVDSRKDIAGSVNRMLADMGFPARDAEEIYGLIGGGIHKLVLASLPPDAVASGAVDEGVERFWRIYKDHVLDTTVPYDGIPEIAQALSGVSGLKLGVATNKPLTHAKLILNGLNLSGFFSCVKGWVPGLPVKPDPAILLLALRELDVSPDNAVMVGDGMSDLLAARAAGVKCCLVGYGYGDKARLLETGPDFFAERVEDLQEIIR
ncbi:MAG: HAD family hydrolase [Nitrospirota bacterium]